MNTCKNQSIGSASNAEKISKDQAGAGAGLSSMAAAFDAASAKAAAAVPVNAPSVEDDYAFCQGKAIALNVHLRGLGHSGFYFDNEWLPQMRDAIQTAMLALQLWRRGVKLVRDEDGAEIITPDCKAHKRTAGAVVWPALRRGLWGDGTQAPSGASAVMENASAFEAWRQTCNGDGDGDESQKETKEERAARWLAALPGILTAYVNGAATINGRSQGTALAARRKWAAKVDAWATSLLTGAMTDAVEAAAAAGFHLQHGGKKNPLQALAASLTQAGFKVDNGAWRAGLPRKRRTREELAEAAAAVKPAKPALTPEERKARDLARKKRWQAKFSIAELRAMRNAAAARRRANMTPEERTEYLRKRAAQLAASRARAKAHA